MWLRAWPCLALRGFNGEKANSTPSRLLPSTETYDYMVEKLMRELCALVGQSERALLRGILFHSLAHKQYYLSLRGCSERNVSACFDARALL